MRRSETDAAWAATYSHLVEFIEDNYGNPDVTLDDFIVQEGYSRRSVQRLLAAGGTGWRDMLTFQRLHVAKRLLVETNRTVKEISRSVGYKQQHQFAKTFKKQQNMTPTQYRRLARAEARR